MVKIGDLTFETGNFFQSLNIIIASILYLSPIQHFKLMSIVAWRLLIKQNQQHSAQQTQKVNNNISVKVDGKEVDILSITSHLFYKEFKPKKQPLPATQTAK